MEDNIKKWMQEWVKNNMVFKSLIRFSSPLYPMFFKFSIITKTIYNNKYKK